MGELKWDGHLAKSGRSGCASRTPIYQIRERAACRRLGDVPPSRRQPHAAAGGSLTNLTEGCVARAAKSARFGQVTIPSKLSHGPWLYGGLHPHQDGSMR
jgi:hypothetical protein